MVLVHIIRLLILPVLQVIVCTIISMNVTARDFETCIKWFLL